MGNSQILNFFNLNSLKDKNFGDDKLVIQGNEIHKKIHESSEKKVDLYYYFFKKITKKIISIGKKLIKIPTK